MRQRAAAAGGGGGRAAELLDRDAPLATAEQEEVVAELRSTLVGQARGWRRAFAAIGFCVAAVFAWFAAAQAIHPWVAFRHHSGFKETLPAGAVVAAEAASAACLAAAAYMLLCWMPQSTPSGGSGGRGGGLAIPPRTAAESRALAAVLAASFIMAAFWVGALLAAGRRGLLPPAEQLRTGWLPAAPLAFSLLAGSVSRQYADSAERLKALEAQMYAHEGA